MTDYFPKMFTHFTTEQSSWGNVATIVLLAVALVIGGCGIPGLVLYCRKVENMKTSLEDETEEEKDEEEEEQEDFDNSVNVFHLQL